MCTANDILKLGAVITAEISLSYLVQYRVNGYTLRKDEDYTVLCGVTEGTGKRYTVTFRLSDLLAGIHGELLEVI